MGPTSKQQTGTNHSRDNKPIKKRHIGENVNQPPPQPKKISAANMSAIRPNQKIKSIPRANRPDDETTDPTPTPTIAAGRSRRAIKPNPKYASEDMVTPKMMRNVGGTKSSGNDAKHRKMSTSSDDFFNRNSDDEYANFNKNVDSPQDDVSSDKAYKIDEKESAFDSDLSEIEKVLTKRVAKPRGRPRKIQVQDASTATTQTKATQQPSNCPTVKRMSNTATLPIRSAPTQLQQLRRSLASANAQRSQNMMGGNSSGGQKRKFDDSADSDDSEISYTVARKQLAVSTSLGHKVRVPIKHNSSVGSILQNNKQRMLGLQKSVNSSPVSQPLNGKPGNTQMLEKRKLLMSAKTSGDMASRMAIRTSLGKRLQQQSHSEHANIQAVLTSNKSTIGKSIINRGQRTSSPRPTSVKDEDSGISSFGVSSQQKKVPTITSRSLDKAKVLSMSSSSSRPSNLSAKSEINKSKSSPMFEQRQKKSNSDESPNSTIDDFETMPTFTIVNVNDIINKKGDVLIKSKSTNQNSPKSTVIEFSESISLDEEEEEDDEEVTEGKEKCNKREESNVNNKVSLNRTELEKKKSVIRNEALKKSSSSNNFTHNGTKPQILNHKLGLRNNHKVTPRTSSSAPEKPAPRILNSMVAKRTQPVKPLIANMEDSAEESFPLSLDEEETEDEAESKSIVASENKDLSYSMDMDTEDTESQNTEQDEPVPTKTLTPKNTSLSSKTTNSSPSMQRRSRPSNTSSAPIVVTTNKKRLAPAAAKENSLAATNLQESDSKTSPAPNRKVPAEKVVISKQGDKIIKKITCFETWYVINMPLEPQRQTILRNVLDVPLIKLANNVKSINLPSSSWSCKVTLYELSAMTLARSTLVTYTGDLTEYNINEEDRAKYQPSCVMFRRSIENRQQSRMPYDRAVIFKNKTFSTNIEGKNVRLVGAPNVINNEEEVEILLEVVDALTLQSDFVEFASSLQ